MFKNRNSNKSSDKLASRDQPLFINIQASRAADLVDKDQLVYHNKPRRVNPVLVACLNGISKKTKRKLSTINPSWDQVLSLPLKPYDRSSILYLCVYDKHRAYKNYLGELRLDIRSIFASDTEDSEFVTKTEPKWYKLYSNSSKHAFVTGSVLISFELSLKKPKGILKKKKTVGEFKTDNGNVVLKVEPPSRQNTEEVKLEALRDLNLSEVSLGPATDATKETLFREWNDSLIYSAEGYRSLSPNDQGFYSDTGDVSEVSESEADVASISDRISNRSDESELMPQDIVQQKMLDKLDVEGASESDASIMSSDALTTELDEDSDYFGKSDFEAPSSAEPQSSAGSIGSVPNSMGLPSPSSRKRAFSFKGRRKRRTKKEKNPFEIRNRAVDGILFVEVVSCSDLPAVRRWGRFDMDPFVVVTFGKQTFRTSWKHHNLNPVFNERLAFEVLKSERNFEVNFLVLDKDRFSLHDNVANLSVPFRDLAKTATASSRSTDLSDGPGESMDEFTDSEQPENENIKVLEDTAMVETMQKKLIRKKLKLKPSDTSKFRTLELNLNLEDEKYKDKHSPKLKVRVRYVCYKSLRRSFWHRLLTQYSLSEEDKGKKTFDYIELIYVLDSLGCDNSDEVVNRLFDRHGKSQWGGDTMNIEEITDFLEDHVNSNTSGIKLFEIEQCPNCMKKNLSNKNDRDIITHFAICGSKDWSVVNKLLVSSYVTPQLASKRWYTKVLIKLSYGKYQLGSNSANILVQDRVTGIILEEKMGVYVRLGIRLLYKGLDQARKRRIRVLLKKLSVKQGTKFDDPASKHDIPSFVKFHKLDLSQCLEPDISKYETFNDFFYRKLKDGARPIEGGKDPDIVTSPADCRCVAFDTVDEATELWIKGRNFTIAKLFNGNFYGLENTDLYKGSKCAVGVFRLAPQDYHRFHSPVSGVIKEIKFIDGEYYTVNPMAIRSELDVFGENVRALIAIETETFGTVVMVPVGAMMVGSTVLTKNEGDAIEKGEEMGYFKFGGSTVVLLFDKSKFQFDSDLISNSNTCVETLIRVGQSIGHAPSKEEYRRDHVDFNNLSTTHRKNLIRVITGGDLADSKEIKSWEAANIKLDDRDIASVMMSLSDEEEGDHEEEGYGV